ncbi:MAG TPA: NAD(P)-dependent oxidoreductase [Patescibacteria group bacterium]|nr:NAD(P)-dependent oxidoreductase [Patescibacteria group bacterium]
MKTVFFEVEEWEKPFLKQHVGKDMVLVEDLLTPETASAHADAEIISTFITSPVDKNVLSKMPHLKYITTRSTGFDHIDLAYCKEKDIVVSNVPSYGVHTVAEHTFGLILALAKKLIPSIEQTRRGDFSLSGLEGIDLNGKTLGVIGAGKIGTMVIHLARAFGMHVLVYTRHPKPQENHNVEFLTSLESLLGRSDFVTLHLPLTPETKHFINKKNIGFFKKGAYLINTARGGLVETEALLDALAKKQLAGAGLDVLEDECDIREERELLSSEFLKSCDLKTQLMQHMLLNRDDVLVTPHKAFDTKEAIEEILETTMSNIKHFEEGKPQNMVEVSD